MSQAWSQLQDVDRLCNGLIDVEFAIPLSAFPRLPQQPDNLDTQVQGLAQFRREGGFAVADLALRGSVQLTCQRCLAPMRVPVDGTARIALVASEAEAASVPADFEPVRTQEGRIRVRDLVEEELLLALPIVALHASSGECAPQAQAAGIDLEAEAALEDGLQKPFANLGELLKR